MSVSVKKSAVLDVRHIKTLRSLPMLSQDTIDVIKSTIPLLEEHGDAITQTFYKRMFERNPQLKNIFNMTNQATGDQPRSLRESVVAYAANIDNLAALVPAVKRIAHKHTSLGVQANMYPIVGENLLAAIQDVLSLPDEHAALTAWGEAYGALADILIGAEAELYTESDKKEGGWKGFREFYIDRIVEETPEVKSFYLRPLDLADLPDFEAGQFVGVRVRPDGSEFYSIRQYTLSSTDHAETFRISVKAAPDGSVSNYLHSLKVGESVSLQPPFGVFTLANNKTNKVLLAGGIGMTPMMSLLQGALANATENTTQADNILFVQCDKDEAHQVFKNEMATLKDTHGFAHKLAFDSSDQGDHQGLINKDIIQTWLAEQGFSADNTEVYFCGPRPFMKAANDIFTELGFSAEDIHYEVFGPTTAL